MPLLLWAIRSGPLNHKHPGGWDAELEMAKMGGDRTGEKGTSGRGKMMANDSVPWIWVMHVVETLGMATGRVGRKPDGPWTRWE